jgi:hypothetical protein
VRRRRRNFLQQEDLPTTLAQDLTLNPVPTIGSSVTERQGADLERTTTEGKLSSADMKLLAQQHTVLGAKAQQQLVYQKAERDLLLVSLDTAEQLHSAVLDIAEQLGRRRSTSPISSVCTVADLELKC